MLGRFLLGLIVFHQTVGQRPIAHLPPSPSLYRSLVENGGSHRPTAGGTDRSHLIPVTLISGRRESHTSSFLDPLTGAIYLLPEADVNRLESERPITYATTNAFPSLTRDRARTYSVPVTRRNYERPQTRPQTRPQIQNRASTSSLTFNNPKDWVIRRISSRGGPAIVVRRREPSVPTPTESSEWRYIEIESLLPGIDQERAARHPKIRVPSTVLDILNSNSGLRPGDRFRVSNSSSRTSNQVTTITQHETPRFRTETEPDRKSTIDLINEYDEEVPEWTPPPECAKVNCNFEQGDACHYRDLSASASVNASFSVLGSKNLNRKWGTTGAVERQNFVGAYLKPTERAVLKTRMKLSTSRVLRLYAYASVKGVEVLACCGTLQRCPYVISSDVSAAGGNWKEMNLICPKGAKRIVIICRNIGDEEGACGIDYIRLLVNSDNPDRTFIDPCKVPETDYSDSFVDVIESFFSTDIRKPYEKKRSKEKTRVDNVRTNR